MNASQTPWSPQGPAAAESASDRTGPGRLETGRIPWGAFLPVGGEAPVLAVGLDAGELLRLARFWRCIHVYDPDEGRLRRRLEGAAGSAPDCRFVAVAVPVAGEKGYQAIAVGVGRPGPGAPRAAFELLGRGGGAAWAGEAGAAPAAGELVRVGFAHVRDYALLPPGRPKLVVPLSSRKAARAGLSFHMPGRRRHRAAVRLAGLAAAVGLHGLMGRRRAASARKPGVPAEGAFALDRLSQLVGRPLSEWAVYVGEEKLTLRLLDEQCEACGVAKLAETTEADKAVEREAAVLAHLARAEELRDSVPRVVALGEWHGHALSVQTGAGGRPRRYSAALTPAHMRFLTALARADRRVGRLEDWSLWPAVLRWSREGLAGAPEDAAAVRAAVQRCGEVLGKAKVPLHRVHGDFAPWNTVLCAGRLTVVDWEASDEAGLPLLDLLHFAARVARLIRNRQLPLRQLLAAPVAVLGVGRELRALTDALSLTASFGYTDDQVDAVVRLCLIAEAMNRGADS